MLPQVSDAENILGIVQIENIQILAEAYDVALSISISKGQWMPTKQSGQGALHFIGRWATKALGTGWDSVQVWHGYVKHVSCKLHGVKHCQGTGSLESLAFEL